MNELLFTVINLNPAALLLIFVGVSFLLTGYVQKRIKGTRVGVGAFINTVSRLKNPALYKSTQRQYIWIGAVLVAVGVGMIAF